MEIKQTPTQTNDINILKRLTIIRMLITILIFLSI
jgi:hypothetical protein